MRTNEPLLGKKVGLLTGNGMMDQAAGHVFIEKDNPRSLRIF